MTATASGQRQFDRPSKLQLASLALLLLALSTDYRSENVGGDSYQYILVAVGVIGAVLSWFTLRTETPVKAGTFWALAMMVLLVMTSFVGGMANGVSVSVLLRLELRFLLMLLSAAVVTLWLRRGFHPATVVALLIAANTISIAFNVGYTIGVRRESLEAARYHIAPIGATVLAGLSLYGALKNRFVEVISLLVAVVSVYFSATRTYALGIGVMALWLAALSVRHHAKGTLALLVSVLLAGLVTMLILGGSELWAARFSFRPDLVDPTWQTRLAEYTEQWRLLTESEWALLFGKGLGGLYTWDLGSLRELIYLGVLPKIEASSDFGHSFWVYSLFSQGVLFGWILPFIFLTSLIAALKGAWSKAGDRSARSVAVQVSLALVGCFVATFFAHQFGDRLYCVTFGALVALAHYCEHQRRAFSSLGSYGTVAFERPLAQMNMPYQV